MRLSEYLKEKRETESAFARRAHLGQRTINRICSGMGCTASTALAVIRASRAAPTKTGGVVTLEGLQSEPGKSEPGKTASRKSSRKKRGRAARGKSKKKGAA